jgi:branched-chain amino acid transport system substrate-binding protein
MHGKEESNMKVKKKASSFLWKSAVAVLTLVLLIALAACGNSSTGGQSQGGGQSGGGSGQNQGGGGDPIKIGVPTPLSAPGDYKAGEINVNTVKLAQEHINNAGGINGRNVELVISDDQGNVAKGVSLVQSMITKDNVSGIVGVWHANVALAQVKVADEQKVPILLHYSWPDEITQMHSDYVFRVSPFNSQIAQLIAPFIVEQGYKNVAIMAEDSSYGIGFSKALEKAGQENGFNVETIVISSDSTDLSPELLKLKQKSPQPDLLVVASVYQPMYLIPKQAGDVGLYPDTHILAGWDYPSWSEEFWPTVGEYGKGIMYPSFYAPQLTLTELGRKFKEDYKAKYQSDPPIYAYYLYDEMMLLAEAMKQSGSSDPQKVAEALRNIEFEGTTGMIRFERENDPESAIYNQWMGHQIFLMRLNNVGDMGEQAELLWSK